MSGRMGFLVAGVLSTVCIAFLAAALADGRSVVILKNESDLVALFSAPDVGETYGIGVDHDSKGRFWTNVKHPVKAAQCGDHEDMGQLVKASSYICVIVAGLVVIVHMLGMVNGPGMLGVVGVAMEALKFVFFLIATAAAGALVNEDYSCKGPLPKLQLTDHFDINYGIPFLAIGTVASLISIGALVATGAMSAESNEPADASGKTEPVTDEKQEE